MLQKCTEEDFYEIEMVGLDRLSPDGISVGFLGACAFSGFMLGTCAHAINYSRYITNPIWPLFIKVSIVIFIVQLIVTVFYANERNAFRFQKSQAIILCFIYFEVSMGMYPPLLLLCEDRGMPSYITNTVISLMVGGIAYLIISTIRGIRRVKQGEFRKGGKKLYNFQQSKGYISLPLIFGATMFGGAISKAMSNMTSSTGKFIEIFFLLFICVIVQYGTALVWPEFFLLAYCKLRFKSFIKKNNRKKKVNVRKFK